MEDSNRTTGHLRDLTNNRRSLWSPRMMFRWVRVEATGRSILGGEMHLLSRLKSARNVCLPMTHNLLWGFPTVPPRRDRLYAPTRAINLFPNRPRYRLLLRQLTRLAYILTDLRLFHHRAKALHSVCHRTHPSPQIHSRCHLRLRQVPGVMPRLGLLPVPLPTRVVLHPVHRGTAETIDTLLQR